MYTEADKCPPLFRHDVPRHTIRAKEQGSSSLLLCSLLHLCVDTADVARATDTHAELIKRRRDVNPARGTPDGILMSGVSSPLSDSPSDALMPSKCTLPTFSCVSRPRPLPRDSWLRRRAARVGVAGVGRFFDVLVHSRNSCKRKFFLRPSVCTICGLEFLVCRVRYVQFVETVLNESYEIVELVRFPGIWANSGFILSLLRSRGTDYTSCFSPV